MLCHESSFFLRGDLSGKKTLTALRPEMNCNALFNAPKLLSHIEERMRNAEFWYWFSVDDIIVFMSYDVRLDRFSLSVPSFSNHHGWKSFTIKKPDNFDYFFIKNSGLDEPPSNSWLEVLKVMWNEKQGVDSMHCACKFR